MPEPLSSIDEKLAEYLGVRVDPVKYVAAWVDRIGRRLAIGQSFSSIAIEFQRYAEIEAKTVVSGEYAKMETMVAITQWLASRYDVNAWRD